VRTASNCTWLGIRLPEGEESLAAEFAEKSAKKIRFAIFAAVLCVLCG
jgi:hypothetical protein